MIDTDELMRLAKIPTGTPAHPVDVATRLAAFRKISHYFGLVAGVEIKWYGEGAIIEGTHSSLAIIVNTYGVALANVYDLSGHLLRVDTLGPGASLLTINHTVN